MMHGTADLTVPYVDGKAVYTRAQAVGLGSELITMNGAPHVPWDVIFGEAIFSKVKVKVNNNRDIGHCGWAELIGLWNIEAPMHHADGALAVRNELLHSRYIDLIRLLHSNL